MFNSCARFRTSYFFARIAMLLGRARLLALLTGLLSCFAHSSAVAENDAAFTTQTALSNMTVGESYAFAVTMTNKGTTSWTPTGGYSLMLQNPSGWSLSSIANTATVTKNGGRVFSGTISPPSSPGTYIFQWCMAQNGVAFGTCSTPLTIQVAARAPSTSFVSQTMTSTLTVATKAITVTMRNTGNTIWKAGQVSMAIQNPADNTIWGISRLKLAANVAPNANGAFTGTITAPAPGYYDMQWRLFEEGGDYIGDVTPQLTVAVAGAAPSLDIASPVEEQEYIGDSGYVEIPVRVHATPTGVASIKTTQMLFYNPNTSTYDSFITKDGADIDQIYRFQAINRTVYMKATDSFNKTTMVPLKIAVVNDGATHVSNDLPKTMVPGVQYVVTIVLKNSGGTTWTSDTVSLVPLNATHIANWGDFKLPVNGTVAPGGTATFTLPVTAPDKEGSFPFQVTLSQSSRGTFTAAVSLTATVARVPPTITMTAPVTGTAVEVPTGGTSALRVQGRAQPGTNATITKIDVLDGTVVVATVNADTIDQDVNLAVGSHSLKLRATDNWNETGLSAIATVTVKGNDAAFTSQSVPAKMEVGKAYTATVTMRNSGNKPWVAASGYSLGSQNPPYNAIWRDPLVSASGNATVAAGGTVTFSLPIVAPTVPGKYNFQWQMVQDGTEWFGAMTPNVEVTVNPVAPYAERLSMPGIGEKFVAVNGKADVRVQGVAWPGDGAVISKLEVLDGTTVIATGDSATIDAIVQLVPGTHTLKLRATDNFNQVFTATLTTAITVLSNNATAVSRTAAASMVGGTPYQVTVVMRNSGTSTWTPEDGYALGAVPDNATWVAQYIPVEEYVAPGANATFTFNVTAPGDPAAYPFQWQMLRQNKSGVATEWFGAKSAIQTITVTGVPPTVNLSGPAANTSYLAQNGTAQVPVSGTAKATGTATITLFEVLDGTKVVYSGSGNTMNTSVPLAPGAHTLQLRATDSRKAVTLSQTTTITVLHNDAAITNSLVPSPMYAGDHYTITLAVKNTGDTTWQPYSAQTQSGVALAELPIGGTVWSTNGRVQLTKAVAPGETYTFNLDVVAPAVPKAYPFQWRMSDESKELFGSASALVNVTVAAAPVPVVAFAASPVNQRVASGQSATLTLTGSGTLQTGLLSKLEVFADSGSGYGATPVKTVTGNAAKLSLNESLALNNGSYRLKLRASDGSGHFADSTPVTVNVTDSSLLGQLIGVRSTGAQQLQLIGWACRDGAADPLNYQVFVNAPPALGGVEVASGAANLGGEADDAAVQAQCHTPGASHFFAVDVASLQAQYPGAPLYVAARSVQGETVVLPCEDHGCRVPDGIRIGLTSPNINNLDRFRSPIPAFARAVVTGFSGTLDEVSFNINGEWLAAVAEGAGSYSASKSGLPASVAPYAAYAKVRQGETTLISDTHLFYVDPGIEPGEVSPKSGSVVAFGAATVLSTVVKAKVEAGQSVQFFIEPKPKASKSLKQNIATQSLKATAFVMAAATGSVVGEASFDGSKWTYVWTPAQEGVYEVTAKFLDNAGVVLMQTPTATLTVSGNLGPVDSKPLPVAARQEVEDLMKLDDAGALPGEWSVGPEGAAQFSMRLAVPPGTAGMAPELSLNYASDGPNGLAGLGWSIGGMSSIHRCAKTIAQDGVAGRISFESSDRLCLDGERLLRVNGSNPGSDISAIDTAYWANDAEYRTEHETYARISRQTNGSFKVEARDGRIHYYGAYAGDNGSTIAAQGRSDGQALLWARAATEDRVGNYLTISYSQDGTTGEYLPKQIRYGGNTSAQQSPDLAVRFEYQSRNDAQIMYIGGSRNDMRQRLAFIRTYINTASDGTGGALVREHALHYVESSLSGRSLVDWMQACTDVCLLKTTFKWGTSSGPDLSESGLPIKQMSLGFQSYDVRVTGNFDGSGRTSFLVAKSERCGLNGFSCPPYQPTIGDGAVPFALDGNIRMRLPDGSTVDRKLSITGIGAQPTQILVADMDGDGRDDLIVTAGRDFAAYCKSITGADGLPDFNCQTGFSPEGNFGETWVASLVDLRHDQRAHWVGFGQHQKVKDCYLENGVPKCSEMLVTGPEWIDKNLATVNVDLSKQGRSDFFRIYSVSEAKTGPDGVTVPDTSKDIFTNGVLCVYRQDGLNCQIIVRAKQTASSGQVLVSGAAVGDLNGDGLGDFTYVLAGTGSTDGTYVCLSTEVGADCHLDAALSKYPETNGSKGAKSISPKAGDLIGDGLNRLYFTTKPNANDLTGAKSVMCRYGLNGLICQEFEYSEAADVSTQPVYFDDSDIPSFLVKSATSPDDGEPVFSPLTYAGDATQDRLVSIRNGVGGYDEAEYMRGNEFYKRTAIVDGSPRVPVYPQMSVAPGIMVKQLYQNSGRSSKTSLFHYAGYMVDAGGRGSLGFGSISFRDVNAINIKTELSQDHPWVGMALRKESSTDDGVVLRTTRNKLDVQSYLHPSGVTTAFPFVSEANVHNYDFDRSDMGETTTVYEYGDGWGNLTLEKSTSVGAGQTFVSEKKRTYFNDNQTWLVGLPKRTENTTSAPGYDNVTRTTEFDYKFANGLPSSMTVEPDSAYQMVTSYDRSKNLFGLINKETQQWSDPQTLSIANRVLRDVEYDKKGRFVITERNAVGHKSVFEYAAGSGAKTSVKDANGLVTKWTVDGFGRVRTELLPDGTELRKYSKLCTEGCPPGASMANIVESFNQGVRTRVPTVTYTDSLGKVLRTMTWGYDDQKSRAIIADMQYDGAENLLLVEQPHYEGEPAYLERRQTFDTKGRLETMVVLDESGAEKTFRKEYHGLSTDIIDFGKNRTTEKRDVLGRMKELVDAKQGVTAYVYEPFGNLGQTIDPNGNVIKIEYDRMGRRTDLHDPDLGWIHYDLDPVGRTWAQTSPNDRSAKPSGQKSRFEYDGLDRLTGRYDRSLTSHWVYDKRNDANTDCESTKSCGRLVEAYTMSGSQKDYDRSESYDEKGRLLQTTMVLQDASYTSTFSYDPWGRLERTLYQRGSGQAKAFDLRYNANGYLAKVQRDALVLWQATQQDAAQRVTSAVLGNGLTHVRSFSPYSGRQDEALLRTQAQVERLHQTYQYDERGNVKVHGQYWEGGGFAETFGYDELNRLVEQTYGQNTQTFAYDAGGNLTSKTGIGTGKYEYPVQGSGVLRPHAVKKIPGIGQFEYDDNGNQTSGNGRSIDWTSFNMPERIRKADANSYFTYGPDFERTRQDRSDANSTTSVVYAGAQEVEIKNGVATVKTYWPNGIGFEVEGESGGDDQWYWTHSDRLGSIVAISDVTGKVVETLEYDSWGKRRSVDDNLSTPDELDAKYDNRGYTGHEMLDNLDLVHMNGRVYDPALARFLSGDPHLDIDDGQGFNRFSYVLNNPVNMVDPSGFDAAMPSQTITGPGRGFDFGLESFKDPSSWMRQTYRWGRGAAISARNKASAVARHPAVRRTLARGVARQAAASVTLGIPIAGEVIEGGLTIITVGLVAAEAVDVYRSMAADSGKDSPAAASAQPAGARFSETKGTPDDPNDPDPDKKDSLRYSPIRKHEKGGWGSEMDLNYKEGSEALNNSIEGGKQRYAYYNGRLYEFQPDNTGGWHGYPIRGNEAPTAALRQLLRQESITKSEYMQLIKGK